MNINEKEIIELVHSTKSIIYNKEMAHAVTVKGAADYVTKVDVAVQEYLKRAGSTDTGCHSACRRAGK